MSHLSSHLTTLLVPGESQHSQSQHPRRLPGRCLSPGSPCHLLPSPRWRREERGVEAEQEWKALRVGGARSRQMALPCPCLPCDALPRCLTAIFGVTRTLSCVKAECAPVSSTPKDARFTGAGLPQWKSYSYFSSPLPPFRRARECPRNPPEAPKAPRSGGDALKHFRLLGFRDWKGVAES